MHATPITQSDGTSTCIGSQLRLHRQPVSPSMSVPSKSYDTDLSSMMISLESITVHLVSSWFASQIATVADSQGGPEKVFSTCLLSTLRFLCRWYIKYSLDVTPSTVIDCYSYIVDYLPSMQQ